MAAAVGAGLGRIASGGDLEDALKDGALAFGIGSIPGVGNFAAKSMQQFRVICNSKQATAIKMADKAAEGVSKGFSLMSPGGILTAASLAGMALEKKNHLKVKCLKRRAIYPNYEGKVVVKPFYSPITNQRYMTLEEMERMLKIV